VAPDPISTWEKQEYFDYTLVDSVKDWRAKWFYAKNVLRALSVHNNARPSANNGWEKETLTPSETEKIKPFLKEIKALKIRGLSGMGIIASFIRRRVQPLRERVHYGFEYIGVEDPTWMSKDELSKEEILGRIQNILKDVGCIPLKFVERDVNHSPAAVSGILYTFNCFVLNLHAV
jgi:hypothetical protein